MINAVDFPDLTIMNKIGKTLEEWEAGEKAEKQTFKGKVKYAYEDYFYYPIYRFVRKIKRIPDNIVDFYQRGKRGYADSDAWSIHYYLNSFMPKLLRTMIDPKKGGGNSYPMQLKNAKEWNAIVEKIAKGFEASKLINEEWFDITKGKGLELEKQRIEGFKLFIKWYDSLWD